MPVTPTDQQSGDADKDRAVFTRAEAWTLCGIVLSGAVLLVGAAVSDHTKRHLPWVVVGAAMLLGAAGLWGYRDLRRRLGQQRTQVAASLEGHNVRLDGRQSAVLDAIAEVRGQVSALSKQVDDLTKLTERALVTWYERLADAGPTPRPADPPSTVRQLPRSGGAG